MNKYILYILFFFIITLLKMGIVYAENNNIYSQYVIVRDINIIDKTSGKLEIVYKGTYFTIYSDNVVEISNDSILLRNVRTNPYMGTLDGYISYIDIAKLDTSRKAIKWPFKVWKTDLGTIISGYFNFQNNGKAVYKEVSEIGEEIESEVIYGQVYMLNDIAVLRFDDGNEVYYQPFGIYDKQKSRLCPIAQDLAKCDYYLVAGGIHGFVYEIFPDSILQLE